MSELFAFIGLQGDQGGGGLLGLVPFILIFVIMYFLLIRPQVQERKRVEQEMQDLRSTLKNGDKVITSGGIYGTITAVRDETVQLRVADAVKIEVLRSAISGRQPEPGQSTEAKT